MQFCPFGADNLSRAPVGVVQWPGKRRALPATADGRQIDLIEAVKTHILAKGELTVRAMEDDVTGLNHLGISVLGFIWLLP